MLLHEPSLAAEAVDVEPMHTADVTDSELLARLIEILRARPDLKTGALLEHCRQHEWFPRIEELARRKPELSGEEQLREEFAGCLRLIMDRAEHSRTRRRRDELKSRPLSKLSERERRELAALTARRALAYGDSTSGDT